MKKTTQKLGIIAFWLSWPLLFVYLQIGSRTRVLVVCGEKVLVVRSWHGSGQWSLPGGGLHRGEDPKVGAVRELREETGLVVQPAQLQHLISGTQNTRGLKYDYDCFVVEIEKEQPLRAQMFEVAEAAWKSISELNTGNAGDDTMLYLSTWQRRK